MSRIFKCAVIGVGGRGSDWATNMLRVSKEVELKAVCDIDQRQAKTVAEKCGGVAVYSDVEELLKKESLDFVVIATPHYLHAPFTIMCAEHDVNVLCEKPMAINLQQADQMIISARKNAIKLGIGFQMRFKPHFKYIYDAVRGASGELGSLGRITDFTLEARHHRTGMYYLTSSQVDPQTGVSAGPWRGRWETEGAGILINQAVHDIDIFQYIVGPIKCLSAHVATIAKDHALIEVEDTVTACFTTQAGAVGRLVVSTANKKFPGDRLIVQGENGYVMADGAYGNTILADTRYKNEEDYEVPFVTSKRHNLLDDFLDAIIEDRDPMTPGEEGRKSVEVIRAILNSAQQERTVYFPVKDTIAYATIHNVSRDVPLKPEDMEI
ncbi:MAG TPA: Gfo/Idh/MocA family oxidoreductase [Candidatus Lokiarchaeia archaeon]|nr:Gfo/Idh/MocA family oxidoreductase [Candidatus Lokiarchaeia archaeon]